jgi:oligoendopeptidase F
MAKDDERAETKENVRARAVARTKASKAMAKTSEDEVAGATKDDLADAGDEAMSKTHHTEAAETREDARIETEQGIKTEIKEDDVAVKIHNFQKLGTEQLESNTVAASSFLDTLQAIAAKASDYSRWSLENGSSFLAKLLGVTTFESAIQIQSEHAKTSYAGFIAYLMKLTELQADLAKEFFKPIETVVARVQGGNE